MLKYHMKGYSGYGVAYSPFYDNKLAVASGSNFGLVGNGRLTILDIMPNGQLMESNSFLTQDGLFDLAWNESHENQCLVAQGDGSLRLFDIKLKDYLVAIFKEHSREVFSCNWNMIQKQLFVSSSWDGKVKVWSLMRPHSMLTLSPNDTNAAATLNKTSTVAPVRVPMSNQKDHQNADGNKECIYQATFSPHDPNIVLCCSGNSFVSLFDLRVPNNGLPQHQFLGHGGFESLTCDFNKYRPHIIATGGVDKMIKVWDLRMCRKMLSQGHQPININEIQGHELAVRKIAWSPHHSNMLLSTSYDMTCRIWTDLSDDGHRLTGKTNSIDPAHGCRFIFMEHTEFVFGADWSLWGTPGFVASTGWDGQVCIWNGLR